MIDRVATEAVADFGIDATFEDREAAFNATLVQADICLAAFDAGKSIAEIETTKEAEAKEMRKSVAVEEAMKKSAAEGGHSGEGCRRGCGCEGARRGCGDSEEGRRGGGCDEETRCRGGGGEGVHRGGGGAPEDCRGHEVRGVRFAGHLLEALEEEAVGAYHRRRASIFLYVFLGFPLLFVARVCDGLVLEQGAAADWGDPAPALWPSRLP